MPASNLREALGASWAAAHMALLAKRRSELQIATRQAYAREQEQVLHPTPTPTPLSISFIGSTAFIVNCDSAW